MSSPQLTPVSYVVLGMVAEGATTSYDMKQKAPRLHAHGRRAASARRLATGADERAAANPRRGLAQALLRRGAERGRGHRARAGAGGGPPRSARGLRDQGRHRHQPEARRRRPRRAPARADIRRVLARGGRYSTVTVLARFLGWSTLRPRSRAIR